MALDEKSSKNIIRAKLSFYRKRLDLTQDEVAKRLNISRSTYAYYEGKAPSVPAEVLNQLADIFNIQPEDFLPDTEPSGTVKLQSPRFEYRDTRDNVDETMLLMMFRKLSDEDKAAYLKKLSDRYIELVKSGKISEDII